MIEFEVTGSSKGLEAFLSRLEKGHIYDGLDSLAREGVAALASATPHDSGETAAAWDYEIKIDSGGCRIIWVNRNRPHGFSVAVALQYGHATGTGGYVQGRDYINPAIRPTFDRIADKAWKVVTSA